MSEENNKKYAGIGPVAGALGQASVDGIIAGAGGTVVGAVVGAASHNAKKQEAALQQFDGLAEELTQGNVGTVIKSAWNALPRVGKGIVAAVGVGIAAAGIGEVVGLFHGAKKASAGKEQFNQLTAENAALGEKLHAAEETVEKTKSFAKTITEEREKSKEQTAGAAR